MERTLAIDMDNVLVNIEVNLIDWYYRENSILVNREAMLGIKEYDAVPDKGVARRLLIKPGFFLNASIISGAFEAL